MKFKITAPVETLNELQQIVTTIPDGASEAPRDQDGGGLKMTIKDWGDLFVTLKDAAEFLTALIALHTALRVAMKPETSVTVATPVAHATVKLGGTATPASIEADLAPLRGGT
jgi:hypothetical protein